MDTNQRAMTVLVVDDEPLLLLCLSTSLLRAGYGVMTAGDAAAALKVARATCNLDAVVTDVEMGKGRMNGVELAEVLRSEHPGLPVIVISGSRDGENLAREHGFRFLPKPFFPAVLAAQLNELRNGPAATAARA